GGGGGGGGGGGYAGGNVGGAPTGNIVNINPDDVGRRGENQEQASSTSTSISNQQSTSTSTQESGSQSQSQNQSQSSSNVLHTFDPSQVRQMLGGELGTTQRPESAYTRDMFEQRANEMDALIAAQANARADQLLGNLGARGFDTRSMQ